VKRLCAIAVPLLLAGLTAACDPVTMAVGAGASIGTSAAEERGMEGAVDDLKIRTQISQLWFDHNYQMFQDLTLTVTEGRVLVTGSVKKPESHVDAIRLAWQAAGVRQVIDEVQVTDQSGISDYAKDAYIANNLRGRLMFDKGVKNINYTVEVVNGVVYVMGIAQDNDELDRVIAHARDISNVKRVVSHVVLKDDPARQRP